MTSCRYDPPHSQISNTEAALAIAAVCVCAWNDDACLVGSRSQKTATAEAVDSAKSPTPFAALDGHYRRMGFRLILPNVVVVWLL